MRLSSSKAKIYVAGHRGTVGGAVWKHLEAEDALGHVRLAAQAPGKLTSLLFGDRLWLSVPDEN
jgi:nucleoside-diphosphate-sugar epimerase